MARPAAGRDRGGLSAAGGGRGLEIHEQGLARGQPARAKRR